MAITPLAGQALRAGLVQPDPTTCGSSVLVMARTLNDPSYAAALVEDPPGDIRGVVSASLTERFRQQALALHRATNGAKDGGGRWQLPWPRMFGTQPWALAREMTRSAGRQGVGYEAELVRPGARSATFRRLTLLSGGGESLPVYVGNRWSPRHVVLVLPTEDPREGEVPIYDPADGRRYPITAADFVAGRLEVAGWPVPWFVVVPRDR